MSNFRSEIYNKILLEPDSNTRKEMEKRLNELNCLYCFDSKTVWDPRSKEHQFFSRFVLNNNNFYVSVCENCGEHEFLFDTNDTNQGNNTEYRRFKRNDLDFENRVRERVRELKIVSQNITKTDTNDFVKNEITDCINNEEPSYEVESNFFKQNISKTNFSADVKKICEILGGILQAHIGIPNINLIKKIELSFQVETKNQKNEQVFYHSTDDNKFFTFILIKQIIKEKNGNLLNILNGEKNLTEIECHYWIYKAKNSTAIDILLKKQQDAVNNELNLMTQILDSHYNK
jgi:predicted nucleic-acid-binding Zn-ribbon protein